jgi:hypothetical protein
MTTTVYDNPVRYSEQAPSQKPRFSDDLALRDQLVQQVIFRDQVQTAIQHLIRGYEASAGCSVTRVDYDPREGRITIEALPL